LMNGNQTMWIFALGVTALAGLVDFRTRKIPNWLTVPGLFLGIALQTFLGGWHGTLRALEGAGLALVLLLPLVLLRAFGAGDWKLMAVVGAFLGPILCLFVLFGSIFISGLMAVVTVLLSGRAAATLRNLMVLVRGFLSFGLRAHPEISLDNPGLMKLPFGVAVAVATVVCFLAARLGV
jgi:prepilin peptidase CpaA